MSSLAQDFPCQTCRDECCGPVPLGEHRLSAIREVISRFPRKEIKRLWRQKRDLLTCAFVDTETMRCSIYEAAPAVCTLYGRVPGLQCPHVDGLVQIITPSETSRMLEAEGSTAMLSTAFRWKDAL
jgi:hypothetical protein